MYKKYFPTHHFSDDKHATYLTSEINPNTDRRYDYYLYEYDGSYSWIAVHSPEDSEYGSSCFATNNGLHQSQSADIFCASKKDFIFGINRAEYFALRELVTRYLVEQL